MFKKALSLVLSIVMLITCFSITLTSAFAGDLNSKAESLFSVRAKQSKNKINVTISVTPEQKDIAGIVLAVKYDSSVLKPTKNSKPSQKDTGKTGFVNCFPGEFAFGDSESEKDTYSIAYINTSAFSVGNTSLDLFDLEFEVISPQRPVAKIDFYCREYYSTSETEKNISVSDGLQLIAKRSYPTLEAPLGVEASYSDGGVRITWQEVEGADGYIIYRSSKANSWERIASVPNSSSCEYVDKNLISGLVYKYSVSAKNSYGESNRDETGASIEFIAKPAIASIKNVVGGVEITWNETAGAQVYDVLRREKGTEQWDIIASRLVSIGTSYIDTIVENGVTYEYDVNSKTEDFQSNTSLKGSEITYVSSPNVKSVSNELGGIRVAWDENPIARSYVVYRREVGQQKVMEEYMEVSAVTEFLDANVIAGRSYTYAVKARTDNGDSGYVTNGYSITRVPSTTVSKITPVRNGILIEWNKVSNVAGYNIYRKELGSKLWLKIGEAKLNQISYVDYLCGSGVEYKYAVTPVVNNSEGTKIESENTGYILRTAENLKATNMQEGIRVTWDSVEGAEEYVILKKNPYNQYDEIGTVKGNTLSFTDTKVSDSNFYTYSVIVKNSRFTTEMSENSNELLRLGAIGKATPEMVSGGINVTWDKSSLAESYAVFRKTATTSWAEIARTDKTEYFDTSVEGNEIYSYAVAMVVKGSCGILNTDNPIEIKFIASPGKITIGNFSGYAQISWTKVNGAIGYNVYKSVSGENNFKLLETVGDNKLFVRDEKVEAGITYEYKVSSIFPEGKSFPSEPVKNTYLAMPEIYSITNSFDGVSFAWNSVSGAKNYRVYRKVYGAKYWTYIETVDANTLTYTDKQAQNNVVMCYTVKACTDNGQSAYKARCMTYVKAPSIRFSNSATGVYLTWDENPNAVGYWIYRKENNAKYWTRIACVTTTYFTDTKVYSGGDYTYTIRAYNGKILSGFYKDGWTIRYLSKPKITSVVSGYGAVTCFWNDVPGAQAYHVYRKKDGAKSWSYLGSTTNNFYRDAKVESTSSYVYTVKAFYNKINSMFDYKGRGVVYLTAPTLKVRNSTGGVVLNWERTDGARSYYIYRKENNARSWTKIATVTGTTYTDRSVKSGRSYKYTIRSYDSKTLSGYYKNGWGLQYLSTPRLRSATSVSAGIEVKWDYVVGATSYAVYRKAPGDKSWTRIGTAKGNKNTDFVDKNARRGVRYTYTVRACSSKAASWFFNEGVSCKK